VIGAMAASVHGFLPPQDDARVGCRTGRCGHGAAGAGQDHQTLVRDWCHRNKVLFVHFRDIEVDTNHFHETFHDNGPTGMVRMLEVYSKAGFVGPIRPDHALALAGKR
jgi:mannonate dehydratase